MADDRDWGRRAIHGPYGRTLLSLAATSLVFIVGYLTGPSTAAFGPVAFPAPAPPTIPPGDGFSAASLSESGECYVIRAFGGPPDPSPSAQLHGSACQWMEVTRAHLDRLMGRRECALSGSPVAVGYHCRHEPALRRS